MRHGARGGVHDTTAYIVGNDSPIGYPITPHADRARVEPPPTPSRPAGTVAPLVGTVDRTVVAVPVGDVPPGATATVTVPVSSALDKPGQGGKLVVRVGTATLPVVYQSPSEWRGGLGSAVILLADLATPTPATPSTRPTHGCPT